MNEPGPTAEATLELERVFVLRADPELVRDERLDLGSGESRSSSPLQGDFLELMAELVEADPASR